MDSSNLFLQLDQLDDDIDSLLDSLGPLLEDAYATTTSKLPLLDKAKLHVLTTYAIESVLFSYLRLHGVKAQQHPVFTELTRVKQYFVKIKVAETPEEAAAKPAMALDKSAAGRFIKAGLAGNETYDTEKAERIAKEKAKAHIRFNNISKGQRETPKAEEPVDAGDAKPESEADEDDSSDAESTSASEVEFILDAPEPQSPGPTVPRSAKKEKKARKVAKRAAKKAEKKAGCKRKASGAGDAAALQSIPVIALSDSMSSRAAKRQKRQSHDGGGIENGESKGARKRRINKERADKWGAAAAATTMNGAGA